MELTAFVLYLADMLKNILTVISSPVYKVLAFAPDQLTS